MFDFHKMIRRIIKITVISVFIGGFLLFFILPLVTPLTGPPIIGYGSFKYANLWREKLTACNSLNDVRKQFNCELYQSKPDGSCTYISDPNEYKRENTKAYLYDFNDGDWLAIAYASSHNSWGGGTVITRDNTGRIRVFFGHVCGSPHVRGESLEEVYADIEECSWEEISLQKIIEHTDAKGRLEGRP